MTKECESLTEKLKAQRKKVTAPKKVEPEVIEASTEEENQKRHHCGKCKGKSRDL